MARRGGTVLVPSGQKGGYVDLDPGEIYFIREQVGDGYSEYTKIGLVREKTGRSSLNRAKEHQTGNPRALVPVKVIHTVFVYETETTLHREFANRRILPGEWFRLDNSELDQAISRCGELAAKNLSYIPMFEQAEQLAQVPSAAQSLPATDEATRWGTEHRCATFGLQLITKSLGQYKKFLVNAKARGIEVDDYIEISETAGRETIDKKLFEELHADIVRSFTVNSIVLKGKFAIVPNKDESFTSDSRLAGVMAATGVLDAAVSSADDSKSALDQMHQVYLTLIGLQPVLTKSLSIAEANLQVLCGVNAGIEEVCSWPRIEEESSKTDWKAIKLAHPSDYAACTRMGSSSQRVNFMRGAGAESSED